MSTLIIIILAVPWNIFWFLFVPLLLVFKIGEFPFIGKLFKRAGEYASASLLTKESCVLTAAFIVAISITNWLSTGDISGVDGASVDVEAFRWSVGYFVCIPFAVLGMSILTYFVSKIQLYLLFFVPANLLAQFSPFDFGNIFLWYISYLGLSVPSIIVGYLLGMHCVRPISALTRNFVDKRKWLRPIEFIAVNALTGFLLSAMMRDFLSKRIKSDTVIETDYIVILVLSLIISSTVIYFKYRYANGNLPIDLSLSGPISTVD